MYLFNKGGSVQLSHTRGYYAEYSEENPEGYRDNGERAERMYELKTDWSESINRAISAGNVITNYDGTKKYNFSELDKNNDGVIDANHHYLIKIQLRVSLWVGPHLCGIIRIMQIT